LLVTVAPGEDKTMGYLLSPKRVAAGILGLTLALAGPASAQAANDPAGATPERTAETAPRREDHTDWGWLGLLGLLGLAGLLRRTDRRTGEVPRRTT
jgi:MYXO-CTERM domain-containing protein